jgi:hypothetical protein
MYTIGSGEDLYVETLEVGTDPEDSRSVSLPGIKTIGT